MKSRGGEKENWLSPPSHKAGLSGLYRSGTEGVGHVIVTVILPAMDLVTGTRLLAMD